MAAVVVIKWRSLAVGCVVCALVVTTLAELPVQEPQQTAQVPDVQAAIERIREGEAEEQAEANAAEAGLVPMASPCLMRRPRLALGVDRRWRHDFAAATVATGPALRREMLDTLLTTAPDDLARWRIDLALTENALRHNDDVAAATYLARAAGRAVPESCRADEAFLAAALTRDRQEAVSLLARAAAIDPGFWSALEQLVLMSAAGTGEDRASCATDAVRTLETVVQLGALARRDTQFERLNRAIEAMPRNGRSALLRGMILRQTGEPAAAREAYEQGLAVLGTSECDTIVREGLHGMLSVTESEI